jgi:hypothetical protein
MPSYRAPLRDLRFVLHEVFGAGVHFAAWPAHADIDADMVDAILDEAGKFASEVVLPLNAVGDAQGCRFDPGDGSVTTPPGFRLAYQRFTAGGRVCR